VPSMNPHISFNFVDLSTPPPGPSSPNNRKRSRTMNVSHNGRQQGRGPFFS
jgi:hypothetical protein